jgi:hypothetical protein
MSQLNPVFQDGEESLAGQLVGRAAWMPSYPPIPQRLGETRGMGETSKVGGSP